MGTTPDTSEHRTDSIQRSFLTFRVFVSSTFSDLKAERDALQRDVFPQLREYCQRHGCRFQAIDLRWGVSEEAALDQQTMNICLEELRRCQRTSPRPNFIVLLGQRYGWRPLPSRIPADRFEAICRSAGEDDRILLNLWYPRDDNAVPPEHRLRPRADGFKDASAWLPVERALSAAFRWAAQLLELSDEDRLSYEASATEQEIALGALAVPDAREHVFCFFREISNLPQDVTAREFIDLDETGQMDREAQVRLRLLKDRLRHHLSGNVLDYEAKWEGRGISTHHLAQLCRDAHDRLAAVLDREFARRGVIDPLAQEIRAHETFREERSECFVGRAQLRRQIADYAARGERYVLLVFGPSGSGKSALLARAAANARAECPAALVLTRFAGITPGSSAPGPLLRGLCEEVRRGYRRPPNDGSAAQGDFAETFCACLELATPERPLVLFLDDLDQLARPGEPSILSWLPRQLPPHARVVVSATSLGPCFSELQTGTPNSHMLEVPPMGREEAAALLGSWLTGSGRTLTPGQTDDVLDCFTRCPWPTYLSLAFEEARRWDPLAKPTLGADVPGAIGRLLDRLSAEANHGETFVGRALGYLASARAGLAEDELLGVLSADPVVLGDFRRRSPKSPPADRLPDIVWSRLRFDLGRFLGIRDVGGDLLLVFHHRQLREEVLSRYCADAAGDLRHGALASFFAAQELRHGPGGPLNLRQVTETPWQWGEARQWDQLASLLADPAFFAALYSVAPNDAFALWRRLEVTSPYTPVAAYQPILADPRQYPECLVSLCEYCRVTGHVEQALVLAETELDCARAAGDAPRLRDARKVVGMLLQAVGRPDEALALCREREQTARKSSDLDDLFVSLGNQAELLSAQGHLDSALALIGEQKEIAARLGDLARVFAAGYNEAFTRARRGEPGEAEALAVECERVARCAVNPRHLVMALGLQVHLQAARGDWAAALRLSTEALGVCRAMNWPINHHPVPDTLHDRVKLLWGLRLYEDAILLLVELEKESEALGFREGVRSALSQRALIAKDMGAYREALDLHRRAEALCREMNLPVTLGQDLVNQAILLLERLGEPVTALQKAVEAQTIFETTGQERELANVRKLLITIGQRLLFTERRDEPS